MSAASWACPGCRGQAVRRLNRPSTTINRLGRSLVDPKRFSTAERRQSEAITRQNGHLPDYPVRTRFAPSPTGYLHIGGLRTALFSYLLAKRTAGQFILRIEDTDQKRLVLDAERRLLDDLDWAGLSWDEGPGAPGAYGPYRQSERTHIYQHHAQGLLRSGSAYRCFCTPQAAAANETSYVTSGCYQDCSSLPAGQSEDRATTAKLPFTVRLRWRENPPHSYPDMVYRKIKRLKRSPATPQNPDDDTSIDAADTILVKTDGTPTYHFANVVDDHLMGITHVIRGSEWMASTPLHYDIYHAFEWKPPHFAHVGLLTDPSGAKLSKRSGEIPMDVRTMREEYNVVPEALSNFLTLLGWSNPTKNDVMDMDTLVANFDLKFTRGNTVVAMEKLHYLQKQHVARRCADARAQNSVAPIKDVVQKMTALAHKKYPSKSIGASADEADPQNHLNMGLAAGGQYPLEAFCTAILVADSASYVDPHQYLERNAYFFTRVQADPGNSKKPDPQNQDHGVSQLDLHGFASELLVSRGWYQEALAAASSKFQSAASIPAVIEASERIVSLRLASLIWAKTIDTDQLPRLCTPPEEHVPFDSSAFKNVLAFEPRYLLQSRPEEIARRLLPADSADEQVDALVRRSKKITADVMRHLRRELCGGMTGPHVSAVMAVLGWKESCSRLGVPIHVSSPLPESLPESASSTE